MNRNGYSETEIPTTAPLRWFVIQLQLICHTADSSRSRSRALRDWRRLARATSIAIEQHLSATMDVFGNEFSAQTPVEQGSRLGGPLTPRKRVIRTDQLRTPLQHPAVRGSFQTLFNLDRAREVPL